ncbi:hypothetical protein ACIPI8_22595 [Pseudomonas nitroreducens]|uniref:hypothetical protein n=1 Tax=Pseudomonas nitroreducens TaxID=46680 RepID=UPI003812C72B
MDDGSEKAARHFVAPVLKCPEGILLQRHDAALSAFWISNIQIIYFADIVAAYKMSRNCATSGICWGAPRFS